MLMALLGTDGGSSNSRVKTSCCITCGGGGVWRGKDKWGMAGLRRLKRLMVPSSFSLPFLLFPLPFSLFPPPPSSLPCEKEQCINLFANPIVQRKQVEAGFPRVHGMVYDMSTGYLKKLDIDFQSEIRKYKDIYRAYDFNNTGIMTKLAKKRL